MTDTNVPALLTPTSRLERDNQAEIDAAAPGSWWRVVDLDDPVHAKLKDAAGVEHGLVLLVSEARVVDGELHTIVLAPHPAWGAGANPVRYLADDFLRTFRAEPDGAALREREIAVALGRVQTITQGMGVQPDDEGALLALADEEAKKREADASRGRARRQDVASVNTDGPASTQIATRLPESLLPGGDIAAAQEKVSRQIRLLEGRQAWIKARTEEMTVEMALVSRYQTEKVAASLAGIADARATADRVMRNIATLSLFTGEEITVKTLVDGQSASADEPLTFMQRLLYLDEEVYIHGVSSHDGFNADDLKDIGALLAKNPELIDRMLPLRRSVAIARIRRNRRERGALPSDMGAAIRAVFQQIAEDDEDRRILVLVRDGEKVHMVVADQQTSKAERLFPSRSEIVGLFQERSWRGESVREITPNDLDYTDARAKHDATALHYKRFLIMFYGLHERLGLFGPFMDRSANWLSATTHSDRFRFIHDEESALITDREPVLQLIRRLNEGVDRGSRVVGQWRQAVCQKRAPAVIEDLPNGGVRHKAHLTNPVSVEVLHTSKQDLCVSIEAESETYSRTRQSFEKRVFKARVVVASLPEHRRYDASDVADRVVCIDAVDAATLRSYIDSRIERETHQRWLPAFAEAWKIVSEEERHLGEALGLDRMTPEQSRSVLHAARIWRKASGWRMPKAPRDLSRIAAIAVALETAARAGRETPASEGAPLFVQVDASARITVWDALIDEIDGIPLVWAQERTTGERRYPHRDPSAVVETAWEREGYIRWRQEATAGTPFCLSDPNLADAAKSLISGDALNELEGLMRGDQPTILNILKRFSDKAHEISKAAVTLPSVRYPIGLASMPDPQAPTSRPVKVFLLEVRPRFLRLAWKSGLQRDVAGFVRGIYANHRTAIDRISSSASTVPLFELTYRALCVRDEALVHLDAAMKVAGAGPNPGEAMLDARSYTDTFIHDAEHPLSLDNLGIRMVIDGQSIFSKSTIAEREKEHLDKDRPTPRLTLSDSALKIVSEIIDPRRR